MIAQDLHNTFSLKPFKKRFIKNSSIIREGLTEEEFFLVPTFQAAIEDNLEEDAIWRKYIK